MIVVAPDEKAADAYAAPLERAGFAVEVTATPTDCLDRLTPTTDCVVSTDRLDGTTGVALLRAVRAEYPDVPFVLVATDGDERTASEAVSAGVTEYVPVDDGVPPDLVERVRNAVDADRGSTGAPVDPEVRDVYERISDAFYAVDEEFRFVYLNERAGELLEADPEALLGRSVWEAYPEATETEVYDALHAALETQTPTTFDLYYEPLDSWVDARVYPSTTGLSVYLRDVTERKKREQALRDVYGIVADPERSFAERVDALLEIGREVLDLGYATLSYVRDDEYVFEAIAAPDDADLAVGDTVPLDATNCERVVATEQTLVLRDIETDAPELAERAGNVEWGIACYLGAPVALDGDVCGTVCFYDEQSRADPFSEWEVTFVDLLANWVSRELDHQRRIDRFDALGDAFPDLGYVIDSEGHYLDCLAGPAAEGRLAAERDELLGRTIAEVLPADAAESLFAAVRDATTTGRSQTVEYDRPVEGGRRWFEARVAPLTDESYGPDTVVVVARDVTERQAREQALERQRDELAKLHRINTLIRGITQGLQNATTRGAIETAVCEHLTDSALYRTAWIGDAERPDARDGSVLPQTVTGVDDPARADVPGTDDPAAAALDTGEIQVVDAASGEAPAVHSEDATEASSLAAVPLATGTTTYGVLVVNALAGESIDGSEREVLADLGRTIALAIQRVESQRSLTAATTVEFQLRVPAVAAFGEATTRFDCELTFERRIPVSDGRRLYYFAVDGADPSQLCDYLRSTTPVDACSVVRDGDGTERSTVVEVGIAETETTAIDALVGQGASITEAHVAAGDLSVTAEVAPGNDVRAVVEAVERTAGTVELTSKRLVDCPIATIPEIRDRVGDRLTAKQRAALSVALARGYYEWPRESTAEEVARTMDISSSTLHYHLRRGLRTVLAEVLEGNRA